MRPDKPRDPVAGPDSGPEPPFPIRLSGPVIKGFGRGSKELGIPTANIPPDGLSAYPDLQTGVYYGVVALDPAKFIYDKNESTAHTMADGDSNSAPSKEEPATILPAVLSIGYNPFYKNTVRSVEIHIMSPLSSSTSTTTKDDSNTTASNFYKLPDFYSTKLNLLILGYIRPEYDYVSLEALIDDIRTDCEVAKSSLARAAYVGYLEEGEHVSEKVKEERRWLRTFE
ncbi:riboflavin kinase, putative [Paecilomyces variotii No. 5]|uniref:Riboflavin kinase n=1 Tax=Byssochlamys spectabilis (strain No. 5 / NBRC 109023) TaxID=1356009 RepID=V5GE64_BYSSN|nr:riboflavin kinase, putative [Paecilomyces variotii No. 5]